LSFSSEIVAASNSGLAAAQASALTQGLQGPALGAAKLEGRWIGIGELLSLPSVTGRRAEVQSKIRSLLADYLKQGWMFDPGKGADLATVLKAAKYRIGGTGSAALTNVEAESFVNVLLLIDGLIEEESLFSAHGAPTAPKSKDHDGIAVKFATDHLAEDIKEAAAVSARRGLTRSTLLQNGEASVLASEMNALNKCSFFQLVEAHLEQRYGWTPQTVRVESICYVSRTPVKVAWEVQGSIPDANSGKPTKFTKPTKVTGHLMYAVKPDEADAHAANDPQKCKRLLYHFEDLLADPDVPPTAGGGTKAWEKLSLESILKPASGKKELVDAVRRAAVTVYYQPN